MTEERRSLENGIDAIWINGKIVAYIVNGSATRFFKIEDARAFRDKDDTDTNTTSGSYEP